MSEEYQPCPRCLRQIPRDALEPVKYSDMTIWYCSECAADERKEIANSEVT